MICKICGKNLVQNHTGMSEIKTFDCLGENPSHFKTAILSTRPIFGIDPDIERFEYYMFVDIFSCVRIYFTKTCRVGITVLNGISPEVIVNSASPPVFKSSEEIFNFLMLA